MVGLHDGILAQWYLEVNRGLKLINEVVNGRVTLIYCVDALNDYESRFFYLIFMSYEYFHFFYIIP